MHQAVTWFHKEGRGWYTWSFCVQYKIKSPSFCNTIDCLLCKLTLVKTRLVLQQIIYLVCSILLLNIGNGRPHSRPVATCIIFWWDVYTLSLQPTRKLSARKVCHKFTGQNRKMLLTTGKHWNILATPGCILKIIYDKIQRSEGSSGTPYTSIVDLRPNTDKDKATEVLKNFTMLSCAHAQGVKQEDDMGGDHLIRAIHFRLAWWYKTCSLDLVNVRVHASSTFIFARTHGR